MGFSFLLVTDTNIWIDLENGEILAFVFELPYQLIMSDFVRQELSPTLRPSLTHYGVKTYGLSPEQIGEIYQINQAHSGVSIADLSSLVLARDLPAVLLSGDNPLRKLAEEHAIKVHGILWVLDTLFDHQIISPLQACFALKRILAHNARLPKRLCDQRIKKWCH